MTDDVLTSLELRLLVLGRQELAIEQQLRELRIYCREAGTAGRDDEADQAWQLYEARKVDLAILQAEIAALERKLYGQRRNRKT